MDDRDLDIDDVTDTESSASESTSSVEEGLFKTHVPFVLELHDIRKDDPLIPGLQPVGSAAVGPTVAKIKKHKKKKKGPGGKDTSHTSLSDSPSDTSSVAPSATDVKEEFYDAHESYHAMPESTGWPPLCEKDNPPCGLSAENQIPVALAARVVGQTEADQNPKGPELSTSSEPQTTTPVTHSEPSPIIKPTSPP